MRPDAAALNAAAADAAKLQAALTDAKRQIIAKWNVGDPVVTWNDLARERLSFYRSQNYAPRNARALAIVDVAMYDALLAARRARAEHPLPPQLAASITPLVDSTDAGFPSTHAAVAFAAATALGELFPKDATNLLAKAQEAADSRVWAGVELKQDIDAGRQIGATIELPCFKLATMTAPTSTARCQVKPTKAWLPAC